MEVVAIPFYLNWGFWAVIVAAVALVLSQFPPIRQLFSKVKLELEVYSKISITHNVGNPNLQIHLMINNIGGRKTRVTDIKISLLRDNKFIATLPAQNYSQHQHDVNTVLFTTFSLSPNEEWAHITNFHNFFDRDEENKFQNIVGGMREEINKKSEEQATQENDECQRKKVRQDIVHSVELVSAATEFFDSKFVWESGEYIMNIDLVTSKNEANVTKKFRFIIYEAQTKQLRAVTDMYKVGGGLYWNPSNIQQNIILEVTEI